jgi:hypothetical protein
MARGRWRLLFAVSLIFVASVFLRGQDSAADRSPALTPIPDPTPAPLRFSPPARPILTPPVLSPPGPYPVGRYPNVPGTSIFPQLVRAAGIIFSGRVVSIGQAAPSPRPDHAFTTVTFQIEHAMRGVSQARELTIHEWAGLSTNGPRYYVGEHVLLFLYSPGKLGLTSPVAGAMGRFAMDSRGEIVMTPQHVATLTSDPILGGKTLVPYADFAEAVRRSSGKE